MEYLPTFVFLNGKCGGKYIPFMDPKGNMCFCSLKLFAEQLDVSVLYHIFI